MTHHFKQFYDLTILFNILTKPFYLIQVYKMFLFLHVASVKDMPFIFVTCGVIYFRMSLHDVACLGQYGCQLVQNS